VRPDRRAVVGTIDSGGGVDAFGQVEDEGPALVVDPATGQLTARRPVKGSAWARRVQPATRLVSLWDGA
jgi:hypothetical protein